METESTESLDTSQLDRFFEQNYSAIAVAAVVLLIIYLLAPRVIPRLVRRSFLHQTADFEEGGVTAVEIDKRARTIEHLVITLLRATVMAGLGLIVLGFLGLWSVLTGVGIFLAALTLAGQSIVLDFLMGIFILVEGTYFEGDNISVGDPKWEVAGVVESVGLRRTVVRGPDGTVHSISNAHLRQVSNRTRVFAAAEVQIRGIRDEDLDRALITMNRVGSELAQDDRFARFIVEPHTVRYISDPDDLGWTAKLRGKVVAGQRWEVATALLQRLNRAFIAEDIELNKRGVAPRLPRAGGHPSPPYVPEDDDG